ncbi:MAG: TetR/AcrR family transcriptional regulator [Clostridia bacterium]|nr:TetR/AcrR family transcriptional regulator [Clostridia bacterium]
MKKGDLRKTQILDAAEKLFFEKGYEQTSIQDILDALSLSKGGFYHYFDSKLTMLREICERRAMTRYERLTGELYLSRRSPIDKLNLLLDQVNLFETENAQFAALILKICYREHDAAIREHTRRIAIEKLTPYINDVVGEGIEDGLLHTRFPMEIGKLVLMLAWDADDAACGMLAEDPDNPDCIIPIMEMLNAYRESVETLLGAPFGTLNIFDVGRMVSNLRAAAAELVRLEENAR